MRFSRNCWRRRTDGRRWFTADETKEFRLSFTYFSPPLFFLSYVVVVVVVVPHEKGLLPHVSLTEQFMHLSCSFILVFWVFFCFVRSFNLNFVWNVCSWWNAARRKSISWIECRTCSPTTSSISTTRMLSVWSVTFLLFDLNLWYAGPALYCSALCSTVVSEASLLLPLYHQMSLGNLEIPVIS